MTEETIPPGGIKTISPMEWAAALDRKLDDVFDGDVPGGKYQPKYLPGKVAGRLQEIDPGDLVEGMFRYFTAGVLDRLGVTDEEERAWLGEPDHDDPDSAPSVITKILKGDGPQPVDEYLRRGKRVTELAAQVKLLPEKEEPHDDDVQDVATIHNAILDWKTRFRPLGHDADIRQDIKRWEEERGWDDIRCLDELPRAFDFYKSHPTAHQYDPPQAELVAA